MKISYAIPVCTEHAELEKLLLFLTSHIDTEDEIVVQCDQGNTTLEVYKVIDSFQFAPVGFEDPIKVIEFPLNADFASFKNNLKEHCTGDWIFQIDADELPTYYLINNLKEILKANPTTDLFLVPRINTVKGITEEHIRKWNWNVDERGWVNFPDYQTRVVQNNSKIKWASKVHEVLVGHEKYALLPQEEEWSLYHHKHIDKQEFQNKFYSNI
jgi:glycosyltransferase involved in cell wall biosynthesis